ncbi:hypothetical protein AALP_AAs56912U000300 [Arabis alpina]|uniref:Uncharacterized protein n=1 Tax=Arabis alpina TaxID=50452 RepID=A0A087G2A9_ARAAL|nr:hypothetical protein AALP_AAs56912U000300 [Arabis alpina]
MWMKPFKGVFFAPEEDSELPPAAKGRQCTGTSCGGRSGRGGGGKAAVQEIPREGGGRLNPNRGVPSTHVPTVGVPSTSTGVPSTSTRVYSTSTRVPSSSTGVPPSSTGVPSTSTADHRHGGGGGIPTLPLLTGAASGGSTARTTQAAQFPPARLGPSASQRHNLDLNDSPPSRFQGGALHMTREEPEEEDEQQQEEEDYYADFAEEHIEVEEDDEVDAPQHGDAADEDEAPQQVEAPQQIQDYEQQLEYLLQLPGRERLLRLSDHPLENEETIW